MLIRNDVIKDLQTKFNDIGIIGNSDLVRLIGFHEDEMDYYYHVLYMNGYNHCSDKNDVYFTMVGSFLSLKGIIPDDDYIKIDNVFSLNGAPQSKEFVASKD